MKIEIHNVRHGHCSVVTAPNGTRLMLDCGTRWDDDRFWTPSLHHFRDIIPAVIPLNLDEDHISDFGPLLERCGVRLVVTNPTVGPNEFLRLKNAGMGPGAKAYHKWLTTPKAVGIPPKLDYGAVQVRWYYNSYGGSCVTTNDLSLAVIVQYGDFKILFAGDLENNGWCGMMRNPQFVSELVGVKVFVASHHGRRSGCHEGLFTFLKPDVVIISDDEKQHETQETDAWYRQRTNGIMLVSDRTKRRYVLTTRNDGAMRIDANTDGGFMATWNVPVSDFPRGGSATGIFGGFGR